MAQELLYFKKNVPYTVVVRRNVMDKIGYSLNLLTPWIAVEAESLRDFKIANKRVVMEGLIVPIDAPDIDWETPNALTDEDITELLKNYLKLKSTLPTIDSVPTLSRLSQIAKEQDKSDKIKRLISTRYAEIAGEEITSPGEMAGVSN